MTDEIKAGDVLWGFGIHGIPESFTVTAVTKNRIHCHARPCALRYRQMADKEELRRNFFLSEAEAWERIIARRKDTIESCTKTIRQCETIIAEALARLDELKKV